MAFNTWLVFSTCLFVRLTSYHSITVRPTQDSISVVCLVVKARVIASYNRYEMRHNCQHYRSERSECFTAILVTVDCPHLVISHVCLISGSDRPSKPGNGLLNFHMRTMICDDFWSYFWVGSRCLELENHMVQIGHFCFQHNIYDRIKRNKLQDGKGFLRYKVQDIYLR